MNRIRLVPLAVFAVFAVAIDASTSDIAHAQRGDGVYGRFDATTSVVLGAGASVDFTTGAPGAVVDARVRVFESFGVFSALHTEHAGHARLVSGLELRPFFPALFLQQLSTGRSHLDLFLQSFAVDLGVDVVLDAPTRVGFAWGLSMEIPILSPAQFAHGLGLRFGARHTRIFSDSRPNPALAADDSTWAGYVLLAIGLDAGNAVADWEPTRHAHR